MRILDIDLDFFLSRIATYVEGSERLSESDGFIPWSEVNVRKFLEISCGLNKSNPIKGAYFIKHHEVLTFWRKLVFDAKLEIPFEVVHVDAHADLGMGDASWSYIIGDVLYRPVNERCFPEEGGWNGLGEGNFLAFALACRWLKKLSFVCHPSYEDDLLQYYFKGFDQNSGYLQLPKYEKDKLDNPFFYKDYEPIGLEPPVQFELIAGSEYKESSVFSYVVLTQSPSYTPQTSDKLIPVIMEYIDRIETG